MGLLDALDPGSGLASSYGGEVLAGGLASGGLAGSLLGPCHVVFVLLLSLFEVLYVVVRYCTMPLLIVSRFV